MSDRLGPLASFTPPQTPMLVVRRTVLEANLAAMQAACDAAGVALRAHGKMHKCSTLGQRQIELGAVGLCCQTVGEAEAFVAAGVPDVLVTSPIPPWGAPRLAALAAGAARVAVVADSGTQIERLAQAATAAGVTLDVLVDIDLGTHRAGVQPDEVVALAQRVEAVPGLAWCGVQAYLGHVQHMADVAARREAALAAQQLLRGVLNDLRLAGFAPQVVTGGGTGTYAVDLAGGVFNEIQAGSYAFMDVQYEDCGAPDGQPWLFQPSLFLAATVVSARQPGHVTCDAGLKAHSVDGPPARVEGLEGFRWRAMGDEHGAVIAPKGVNDLPPEGAVVWLQPGHCDPTVNLHDVLCVVAEDGSHELWPIDARRHAPGTPG
jgi:D-serine deaminase-like pyridoxal phosphate-dependent protein